MTSEQPSALKPNRCAWCGGETEFRKHNASVIRGCRACDIYIEFRNTTPEQFVQRWNTRAPLAAAVAEETERCAKIADDYCSENGLSVDDFFTKYRTHDLPEAIRAPHPGDGRKATP